MFQIELSARNMMYIFSNEPNNRVSVALIARTVSVTGAVKAYHRATSNRQTVCSVIHAAAHTSTSRSNTPALTVCYLSKAQVSPVGAKSITLELLREIGRLNVQT